MYRITLECHDVPAAAGDEAARDITEAFRLRYAAHGLAESGIGWIAEFRSLREEFAMCGPEGMKALIAGYIALNNPDLDDLQDGISDLLGYDAHDTVAEFVQAYAADSWRDGIWHCQASGTYALN